MHDPNQEPTPEAKEAIDQLLKSTPQADNPPEKDGATPVGESAPPAPAPAEETTSGAPPLPRHKCHKEVHALKIKKVQKLAPQGTVKRRVAGHTVTSAISGVENSGALLVPEDGRFPPFKVSREFVAKHNPTSGGYFVVYADGYESYSPAEPFEAGYTLIETD